MAHASMAIHLNPEDISEGFRTFAFEHDDQVLGSVSVSPDAQIIGSADELRALAKSVTVAADQAEEKALALRAGVGQR